MNFTIPQLQKITTNNQHNILKLTSSCMWRHHVCDVIICGDFIRDVFEITKVQTDNTISQHLDNFACCYKDLLVLMTSPSFSWRHNLKIFYIKNLRKNSLNMQKILLLSLTKQFLDREQICPPVQIGCKNSPVDIGLTVVFKFISSFSVCNFAN